MSSYRGPHSARGGAGGGDGRDRGCGDEHDGGSGSGRRRGRSRGRGRGRGGSRGGGRSGSRGRGRGRDHGGGHDVGSGRGRDSGGGRGSGRGGGRGGGNGRGNGRGSGRDGRPGDGHDGGSGRGHSSDRGGGRDGGGGRRGGRGGSGGRGNGHDRGRERPSPIKRPRSPSWERWSDEDRPRVAASKKWWEHEDGVESPRERKCWEAEYDQAPDWYRRRRSPSPTSDESYRRGRSRSPGRPVPVGWRSNARVGPEEGEVYEGKADWWLSAPPSTGSRDHRMDDGMHGYDLKDLRSSTPPSTRGGRRRPSWDGSYASQSREPSPRTRNVHVPQLGAAPENAGASPGKAGASPRKTGATPGKTGASPRKTGASPGRTDASPGKTGASPGNTGASPGKTGASPGKTRIRRQHKRKKANPPLVQAAASNREAPSGTTVSSEKNDSGAPSEATSPETSVAKPSDSVGRPCTREQQSHAAASPVQRGTKSSDGDGRPGAQGRASGATVSAEKGATKYSGSDASPRNDSGTAASAETSGTKPVSGNDGRPRLRETESGAAASCESKATKASGSDERMRTQGIDSCTAGGRIPFGSDGRPRSHGKELGGATSAEMSPVKRSSDDGRPHSGGKGSRRAASAQKGAAVPAGTDGRRRRGHDGESETDTRVASTHDSRAASAKREKDGAEESSASFMDLVEKLRNATPDQMQSVLTAAQQTPGIAGTLQRALAFLEADRAGLRTGKDRTGIASESTRATHRSASPETDTASHSTRRSAATADLPRGTFERSHPGPSVSPRRSLRRPTTLFAVIDLDFTLLHTKTGPIDNGALDDYLSAAVSPKPEDNGIYFVAEKLHEDPLAVGDEDAEVVEVRLSIKLRPGAKEFLHGMASLFTLILYTHGTARYAMRALRFLDPDMSLFANRVIAGDSAEHASGGRAVGRAAALAGDAGAGYSKYAKTMNAVWRSALKWKLVGPGAQAAASEGLPEISSEPELYRSVVVVDDRDTLWCCFPREADDQLSAGVDSRIAPRSFVLKVQPYLFGPWGDAGLEAFMHDEVGLEAGVHPTEKDDLLDKALEVLENAHDAWTESGCVADFRDCLRMQRKLVLEDCVIVFSRVIPMGADPAHNWHWRVAESFGAEVLDRVVPGLTTHLVTRSGGSAKHREAARAGMKVVDVKWLYDSVTRWHAQDEAMYPVREPKRRDKHSDR